MIQQARMHLKLAGFDPGRVDGVFDALAADAVRHYQAAQGIPVSGLRDGSTRRVMSLDSRIGMRAKKRSKLSP
jgi:peptidoglycan hydrolase-like protein with peptidoglycan-binding domain